MWYLPQMETLAQEGELPVQGFGHMRWCRRSRYLGCHGSLKPAIQVVVVTWKLLVGIRQLATVT